MYTRHGHHIKGTSVDPMQPVDVARCGGPIICQDCSSDAAKSTRIIMETHTEDTLTKVHEALAEHGVPFEQALDIVNSMQNKGILFRERA